MPRCAWRKQLRTRGAALRVRKQHRCQWYADMGHAVYGSGQSCSSRAVWAVEAGGRAGAVGLLQAAAARMGHRPTAARLRSRRKRKFSAAAATGDQRAAAAIGPRPQPAQPDRCENLANFLMLCATHPAAERQTFLAAEPEVHSTAELIQPGASAGRPNRMFGFPVGLLRACAVAIGGAEIRETVRLARGFVAQGAADARLDAASDIRRADRQSVSTLDRFDSGYLAWLLVPLVAAALLTGAMRHVALSRGWLDVPNSAVRTPTDSPRRRARDSPGHSRELRGAAGNGRVRQRGADGMRRRRVDGCCCRLRG